MIRPDGSRELAPALVVEVAHGQVLVDAPRGPVELGPRDVERVREALAQARAVVLWERGEW